MARYCRTTLFNCALLVSVEERLREEAEIVGEPAALLRLEREDEPAEERVDEEQQHDEYLRHGEERGPVLVGLRRVS